MGPTVSEVMPISICSPKSMGKKLPNELWARPVASKLSERRPLTFFHRRDTENGQKRYFSHFCQLLQCKKIQEVSKDAIWKLMSFIWLNQISLEDSNQSLTGILQWGRKKWWWQESPRTQPCSPFYRASIVYLLFIFLISATTLKHPKHDVELLKPRLQCSIHILDTSLHPHAGRWRCTLPCSPWRSSRKVPLPCFRSHEIDRRLSSHYIHKFNTHWKLRIIYLIASCTDLNLHIWPL